MNEWRSLININECKNKREQNYRKFFLNFFEKKGGTGESFDIGAKLFV